MLRTSINQVRWLFGSAIVGAVLVLALAIYAQTLYHQHNAYFFDAVYYQSYNATLAERLQSESRFSVALDEWLNNDRHPLRTIALLLAAPNLLTHPYGHMLTTGVTLAMLLWLVGYLVYQRRQSFMLAVSSQFIFTALPIYYDLNRGIANYWLEWGAALWLGCALCCILLAGDFPKQKRWIVGFALSAAAAVLSRYIAGVFVVVVCFAPFAYYLWRRWQLQNSWRDVLIGFVWPLSIIMVLAGYFLLAHLSSIVAFYTDYGYAINQTAEQSWNFVRGSWLMLWKLTDRMQLLWWYGGGVIVLLQLLLTIRQPQRIHWLIAAATVGAVPVTLVMLGTVGAFHPILYGVFPAVVAVVAPTPLLTTQSRRRFILYGVSGILVIMAVVSLNQQRWRIMTLANSSTSLEKQFNQQLADSLLTLPDTKIVWQGFFDEYSTIPTMELYYASGRLALPAGQPFFNSQITAWQADYPGLTKEQVAERVYAATSEWVDVAVVFIDPDQGRLNGWMLNDYSRHVADYMARTLPTDSNWEKVFTIESPYYSTLVGYRNLSPNSKNYALRLQNSPLLRP